MLDVIGNDWWCYKRCINCRWWRLYTVGCSICYWHRLRYWWQHTLAGFLQWSLWTQSHHWYDCLTLCHSLCLFLCFLRPRASILAIAHISYGNSVRLSVCLSVHHDSALIQAQWDREFGFSPYYSLESLVFCDKISCRWVKEVPTTERGTPLEALFYRYWFVYTWKWLQIGTDMLLIITNTGNELLRMLTPMTLNDLEPPK